MTIAIAASFAVMMIAGNPAHGQDATAEMEIEVVTDLPAAPAPGEPPAGYRTGYPVPSYASNQCNISCPCEGRAWRNAGETFVHVYSMDCAGRQVVPDYWTLEQTAALFPGATIKPDQPARL